MIITLILIITITISQTPKLDKHIIPLHGNSTLGYYYADIYIGNPPQQQSVIMDTGSGLLALPCSKCTNCGYKHLNIPFKIQDSKSTRFVTCVSPLWTRTQDNKSAKNPAEEEEKTPVLSISPTHRAVPSTESISKTTSDSKKTDKDNKSQQSSDAQQNKPIFSLPKQPMVSSVWVPIAKPNSSKNYTKNIPK